MARQKRITQFTYTLTRTLERVAIAALAAVAASGEKAGVAGVALTIFVVMVVVEESSRHWIRHGSGITLRELVGGRARSGGFWSVGNRRDPGAGKRRTRTGKGRHKKVSRETDGDGEGVRE